MESVSREDFDGDGEGSLDSIDNNSMSLDTEDNILEETLSSDVVITGTLEQNDVQFTVCISLGMVSSNISESQMKKFSAKLEMTKPSGFYHLEFKLLPVISEVSQVDVVIYDHFARVYIDKADAKTCKLYYFNNVAWISWDHKFTMNISDSLLLQLYEYKAEFLLWDNKEKMMPRSKFDKTRNIKCDVDENEMKKFVDKQLEYLIQLEKRNPKNVSYIFEPVEIDQRILEEKNFNESQCESADQSLTQLTDSINKYITPEKKQKIKKKEIITQKTKVLAKIIFKMCHFFSDNLFIIKHLTQIPEGLIDMVVSINLSGNLLSIQQKRRFNPMVICLHSLNDMPGKDASEGVTYEQLIEKCQPVYIKYEFQKSQPYKSPTKPQQRDIYFNEVNVILTGMLDQTELRQYLLGPPLQIEVHDRDSYIVLKEKQNLLFGDNINDNNLSNLNYIKNKKGQTSQNQSSLKGQDKYGICKLSLFELLQGSKYLYKELSILPYRSEKISSEDCPIDKTRSLSLSTTPKYIECNSVLKLTVKLAYSFLDKIDPEPKKALLQSDVCPFSRLIFKIHGKQKEYLINVLLMIAKLNGKTLGFDNIADHLIISVVSTYILNSQQKTDRRLDIVTGFHFIDQNLHLIVVEGIHDRALARLIKEYQDVSVDGFTMLYSTDFVCSERLYISLNLNILKIKLGISLSKILKQPLLYVKKVVPRPCFHAVMRLTQLIECKWLMDAVYYKCFPDVDMLQSLTNIFTTFIPEDLKTDAIATISDKEDNVVEKKEDAVPVPMESSPKTEKDVTHKTVNFIKHNVNRMHLLSEKNRMNAVPRKMVELKQPFAEMQNYSICTFNSIELAKLELLNKLDKNTLYTYCPEFHNSMTFPPLKETTTKYEKRCLKKSRRWILAQQQTVLQCHAPIHRPSEGRLEEIYQPYRDISCYPKRNRRNCDRNYYYTWDDRNYDFDLWKNSQVKPSDYKNHTILSSPKEELHLKRLKEIEFEFWKSKVVVSNTREKFRPTLPSTELLEKGPKASCQHERLKGLLKDKPEKLSYIIYPTHSISALGVANYPELNGEFNRSKGTPSYSTYNPQYETNAFIPGPLWPEHSSVLLGNQTPLFNYESDKSRNRKGKEFTTTQSIDPNVLKSRLATAKIKNQKTEG